MRAPWIRHLALICVFATATACSTDASQPQPSSTAAAPASPAQFTITDYTFPTMVVAAGATVTVIDGDDEPHTVTADDGTFTTVSFDSSAPGTFTAPTQPGSYPIHCTIHPSMHGTLVVQQP